MKSKLFKLVITVPESHADIVRKAMGDAGAGIIGNYSHCTFSTKGIGRFKLLKGANPSIGKVGEQESVNEERIETVCSKDKLKKVVAAIKKVHPYEKIALDIYSLENYEDYS